VSSSKTSVQDFPVPGISYYYAALDSSLIKIGKISFTAGENATIIPAEIPLGTRVGLPETSLSRSIPLPLYPIARAIDTGTELTSQATVNQPRYRDLSPGTAKAVSALLETISAEIIPPPDMKPVIMTADKTARSGGEEYTLKSILDREFSERRWDETEKLLKNFLSIHRSKAIENRAHFYLGQVYYFQDKMRAAFIEFLLAEDSYYAETKPWMDSLFRKLEKSSL
ncbi:MAG: hypothetical protein AB1798_05255, partial [Spirochaetota bacterium]